MKNIIILSIISSTYLLSNDFLPNSTDAQDIMIYPENDTTTKQSLIDKNLEDNTITFKTSTDVDTNTNTDTGIVTNSVGSNDVDYSNIEDLDGYGEKLKETSSESGQTMADNFKNKLNVSFSADDLNSYSKNSSLFDSKIVDGEENNTQLKVIKKIDDVYTNLKTKMSNLKTIECYVTRNLINSYVCPFAQQTFYGGDIKSSNQESKKQCDSNCKEPSTISYKAIPNGVDSTIINKQNLLIGGNTIEIETNGLQEVQYIELYFNLEHIYDTSIPITSEDYNSTLSEEILKKYKTHIKFDVSYKEDSIEDGFKDILLKREIALYQDYIQVKLYIGNYKTSYPITTLARKTKYHLKFYQPTKLDLYYKEGDEYKVKYIKSNDVTLKMEKIKIKYSDTNYWFCENEHFVNTTAECTKKGGVAEHITIGSDVKLLCKTKTNLEREPRYGAYYTEDVAKRNCYNRAKCVPTYLHLNSGTSLPTDTDLDIYYQNISIGCTDSPNNNACTKSDCEELFKDDTMPLVEKTWINDKDTVYTVANGTQKEGTVRPKIDIINGLNTNGNKEQKELVSINEMVEKSYFNMIDDDSYDISTFTVDTNLEKKLAYNMKNINNQQSLYLLMKPYSFDVDTSTNFYVYNILVMDIQYKPKNAKFITSYGVTSGETTSIGGSSEVRDRLYLIQKSDGSFMVFKRIENYEGKFPKLVYNQDGEVIRTDMIWSKLNGESITKYETYSTSSKKYVALGETNFSEYSFYNKFISDKPYYEYKIYDSINDILNTEGILFKNQKESSDSKKDIKIFKLDSNLDEKENILYSSRMAKLKGYSFYSSSKLKYNELESKIIENNAFYELGNSYPTTIFGDGKYGLSNIDMFITGKPSKMSINTNFRPNFTEENKKAFLFMLLYDE